MRHIPGLQQSGDIGDIKNMRIENMGSSTAHYSAHVREDVPVAFYGLDRSLKHYFSDIPVPTKDYVRFMRVRMAGADLATLLQTQGQQEGKTILPVAALESGKNYEINPLKYSLPYYPMTTRFLNNSRDRVAQVYRPVPVLVDYALTVVAQSKRDIGIIQTHLMRRFNPYAELMVDDGRISGAVQLYYKGANVTTALQVPFDQDQIQTWELMFQADAWIPLPEVVTPTVRGTVAVVQEQSSNYESSYF